MMKSSHNSLCWLRRGVTVAMLGLASTSAWAGPLIEVWKDPNCGCCTEWVKHLEEEGFEVTMHDERDMRSVKTEHGVPQKLASCHTATVEGYVIEGHVPAADIQRLLDTADSEVAGLAVPGMPHGSPGMETGRHDDYAVMSWHHDSRTPTVFQEYVHE